MDMSAACPSCGATDRQIKSGTNHSGSPRRHCKHCRRTYTPAPKPRGYDQATRRAALRVCVDGVNFRRAARLIGVHHQSVINWVNAAAARLPAPPTPRQRRREAPADTLELDELHTFVGQKRDGLRPDLRGAHQPPCPGLRRGLRA